MSSSSSSSSAPRARFPEYVTTEARRSSFDSRWPHDSISYVPTPTSLAAAGFFFSPTNAHADRCVCAFCCAALVGWESSDNPISEHQRYVPDCAFAMQFPAGPCNSASRVSTTTAFSSSGSSSSAVLASFASTTNSANDSQPEPSASPVPTAPTIAISRVQQPTSSFQGLTSFEVARANKAALRKRRASSLCLEEQHNELKTKLLRCIFMRQMLMSTVWEPPSAAPLFVKVSGSSVGSVPTFSASPPHLISTSSSTSSSSSSSLSPCSTSLLSSSSSSSSSVSTAVCWVGDSLPSSILSVDASPISSLNT